MQLNGYFTPSLCLCHQKCAKNINLVALDYLYSIFVIEHFLLSYPCVFSFFLQGSSINQAACDIAFKIAKEGDALVAGGVSQTPSYLAGKGKEVCQAEFKKQLDIFIKNNVDFMIAEVCDTCYFTFQHAIPGGYSHICICRPLRYCFQA